MKINNLKNFTSKLLTICAIVFGLTSIANAAINPELISKAANGDYANANSQFFSVSADGRYVVFQSNATNLVSGITDTNNESDIFLRDTQTGTVRCLSCVSAANPTSTGNGLSVNPIITPDGRYVVFASKASDLAGGVDLNNDLDVFRFDTQLNERKLVSVTPSGVVTGNNYSGSSIDGRGYGVSDDGLYVVFSSNASDLTNISDTNNKSDIFVRDMLNNQTRIISRSVSGTAGNNSSFDPTISANGQYLAFTSQASDLLPPGIDGNVNYDVFVYDADAQQLRCASMSTRTDFVSTGSSGSVTSLISKDGSRVAFFTFANDITNIQIPFGNPWTNIVVYDVGFRQNSLVTVNVAGNASGNQETGSGNISQRNVSISANGRYVTFESRASNLSPLTTMSSNYNVFRRDLTRGLTEVVSVTPSGSAATQNSYAGPKNSAMSSDGRYVTFSNAGNVLTTENFPLAGTEIYVRDMSSGITTALTLNNTGTGLGNGDAFGGSFDPAISANGKAVVFISNSTDLTPTPTSNQFYNIFKSKVPTPQSAVSDFDGDGFSDYAIYRPDTNGVWYVLNNPATFASYRFFGAGSDVIVPADFTGDGATDYAVFRPSNGTWYISDGINFNQSTFNFGLAGDKPVPQDFDGDGKADLAVYRNGTWWWQSSRTGQAFAYQFGLADDIPVLGDFDGDGKADYAVFRSSEGTWYVRKSTSGAVMVVNFGLSGDKPVVADYDGDGKSDIGVFRSGAWYVLRSLDANVTITQFGLATDIPTPGSYDADGKADIAVFRPSEGNWYVLCSATNAVSIAHFGQTGDKPVPSAFIP